MAKDVWDCYLFLLFVFRIFQNINGSCDPLYMYVNLHERHNVSYVLHFYTLH